jgi:hypothetical protein
MVLSLYPSAELIDVSAHHAFRMTSNALTLGNLCANVVLLYHAHVTAMYASKELNYALH